MADEITQPRQVAGVLNKEPTFPTVERHVNAEPVATPPIANAFRDYAAASNWMSDVGNKVASAASNALAQKLGSEYGKNPQGTLLPPITEFDKQFANSYHTQAQATLSLQANKLITDSNIEIAKAPRVTPDMIAKSQNEINIGLQNIYRQAPAEIRPQLEYHYGSLMLNQKEQLNNRMIGEQRQDRKYNTMLVSNQNAETAHSLAASGNINAAESIVATTEKINQSAYADRAIDPVMAKTQTDTVRKSMIDGRLQYEYEKARAEGKGEQYVADLANKKPSWIKDADYDGAMSNLRSYIGQQQALRMEDQSLALAKFKVSLAQDPTGVTGSQIAELNTHLDPVHQEQAHLDWITAVKRFNTENEGANTLVADWSNPRSFASASDKAKNVGFRSLVNSAVKQGYSQDNAEVQVMAQAGGVVPEFTRSLKNRLASSNPQMVISAARQIHALSEMNAGQALQGLDKQDLAMFNSVEALVDSQDPNKALQKLHEQYYSQDPNVATANEEKWKSIVSMEKPDGVSVNDWALTVSGLKASSFLTPGEALVHGNDLFTEYKTNFVISGDKKVATKMLQDSVANNYGTTYINGFEQTTKHPIEKVLNLPPDAAGIVQEDIMRQLKTNFDANKKRFDSGEVNEYWELTPRVTAADILAIREKSLKALPSDIPEQSMLRTKMNAEQIDRYSASKPIEVIRHIRNGQSKKYSVVIVSNPFATMTSDKDHPIQSGWDIAVTSEEGTRNLYREAPYLGVVTYDPDLSFIRPTYLKLHGMR